MERPPLNTSRRRALRLLLAAPFATAGPFFTPHSPERASLLDFWQADDAGEFDNEGFRLRGHQFTDAGGRFHFLLNASA